MVERGGRWGLGLERGFDFTMQFIYGISSQQEMLKSWGFLSFSSITVNLSTGENLLKQAKYFSPANKNLTTWSINNAIIHKHSSCGSQNI